MKKVAKQIFIVSLAIAAILLLAACDLGSNTPEDTHEPAIETTPEPPSEPVPALTPEPTPVTELGSNGYKFPFSFSSVDLHGNTVTEEDLGEKEFFFAYLWAVW